MTLSEEPPRRNIVIDLFEDRVGRLEDATIDLRLRCDKLEGKTSDWPDRLDANMKDASDDFREIRDPLDRLAQAVGKQTLRLDAISGDITEIKQNQVRTNERMRQLTFDVSNHSRAFQELADWRLRVDESLNGLGQRVASIGKKQEEHDTRFDQIDQRLDTHDQRFDQIDGKIDALDGKVNALDGKVNALDGKLDKVLEAVRKS